MARMTRTMGATALAFLAALNVASPTIVASPDEELAVADRAAPPPMSDSPEDILRRARNAHFDAPWGMPIDEDMFGSLLITCPHPEFVPELPIKTSTTIVLASVELAAAFVARDEREVYSEYTLRVERVVKDTSPNAMRIAMLAPGDTLQALRRGGALRLFSGRIVPFRHTGFHQPQIGQSYVFFLTRAPAIAAFEISTAYLVKDETVQSLDSPERYPALTDKPLDAFLQDIEAEIGAAAQP